MSKLYTVLHCQCITHPISIWQRNFALEHQEYLCRFSFHVNSIETTGNTKSMDELLCNLWCGRKILQFVCKMWIYISCSTFCHPANLHIAYECESGHTPTECAYKINYTHRVYQQTSWVVRWPVISLKMEIIFKIIDFAAVQLNWNCVWNFLVSILFSLECAVFVGETGAQVLIKPTGWSVCEGQTNLSK